MAVKQSENPFPLRSHRVTTLDATRGVFIVSEVEHPAPLVMLVALVAESASARQSTLIQFEGVAGGDPRPYGHEQARAFFDLRGQFESARACRLRLRSTSGLLESWVLRSREERRVLHRFDDNVLGDQFLQSFRSEVDDLDALVPSTDWDVPPEVLGEFGFRMLMFWEAFHCAPAVKALVDSHGSQTPLERLAAAELERADLLRNIEFLESRSAAVPAGLPRGATGTVQARLAAIDRGTEELLTRLT